jgi:hypothetical protein
MEVYMEFTEAIATYRDLLSAVTLEYNDNTQRREKNI